MKTPACLALLSLLVFVGVSTAQQATGVGQDVPTCQSLSGASRTRAGCDQAEANVVRAEKELSISVDYSLSNTRQCAARVALEYLQWDTIARIEGAITNEDCAASSGDYEIDVRVRDDNGELQALTFIEPWRRDDDKAVIFSRDYPIGDNVELIRVRTRKVSCECADTVENSANPPP